MIDEESPKQIPPDPSQPELDVQERQWGLFAHLSALAGFVIPFGNVLGPFLIWQIKKHELPFAAQQAKEALNFQLTVLLAVLVCWAMFFAVIGLLLLPVVVIGALVLTIIAALKANDGHAYRYPLTLRLVN